MRYSESKETVLPRSSGESLKWVPKVQGRISAESLRQMDRDRLSTAKTSVNILFRATDTVGDFFILKKKGKVI